MRAAFQRRQRRDVKPLFGDLQTPNDCAFLFIALNIAHFRALPEFLAAADGVRRRVGATPTRSGAASFAPGDKRAALAQAQAEAVTIDQAVFEQLIRFASARGIDISALTSN